MPEVREYEHAGDILDLRQHQRIERVRPFRNGRMRVRRRLRLLLRQLTFPQFHTPALATTTIRGES